MKLNQEIVKEINLALSVALACLLALEILWSGSVLAYFNLNYWLIAWVLSAILLLFNPNKSDNLSHESNH